MDNPFSWDYLTTTPGPDEVFGPFAIIFLVVFVIGFIASVVLYSTGGKNIIPDPVLRRLSRRWSGWAVAVFTIGLFFFAIRWLQINPITFGERIWLWVSRVILLAFVIYVAIDFRTHYASAKQSYEEHRRKQQYLRRGGPNVATARPATPGIPPTPVNRPVRKRRR
jgi:amino acid permease